MQSQIINNLPIPSKQSNQKITNSQEFSDIKTKQLALGGNDNFLPNTTELPWQKITKQASDILDASPAKEVYIKEITETKNASPIEGFVYLTMLTEEETKGKNATVPPLHGIKHDQKPDEEKNMAPLNMTTKIYVGSLTIVGLYIMYRAVKKTM